MNKFFLLSLAFMACMAPEASCQTVLNDNTAVKSGYVRHPWAGKRVGYIGDSITDPKNNSNDIRQKYWAYLQQWLGITPYVYGISASGTTFRVRQRSSARNMAMRLTP